MSAPADSCSSPILEPERSVLLQEALADSQLQAVKAQLESRGFGINTDEAQAVQLAGGQQLLIPFGKDAHLVWTRTNGQAAAVGLIRQGQKTLNISTTGEERIVRFLPMQKVEKLLRKLREKQKFQDFEGKLAQKGKRVGKVRVLFDETNKIAILGIANEGDDERIVHQVRIKVKAGKDDEPEDNAEPAIQATACGQATGEVVPAGAKLQPLALDPGDGGDLIGSSYDGSGGPDYGPQICTSQWGYDYHCTSRYPMLMVSTSSLTLPQTFINQQVQASFVVWNSGGGTLTGTVSVPAPFSIVSGSSFSLLPGQPQEVVVRFSSTTPGSFSRSLSISSNGGSATVTATAVAHKVSFSPAQLDFGSGLLVLREQCNDMGVCGLRTEKVGLPIEKTLTIKNEGTVAVTLTLSTSAPYKIVSVLPTLSPGQSGQVTVRFDPSESGSFTGSVQVGISGGQGSVNSSPLVGVAHKLQLAGLDLGTVFSGNIWMRKLAITNKGVTTVSLEAPITVPEAPFEFALPSNPMTLEPGTSKEVTVRFSPTEPGTYTGSLRVVGSLLELPVVEGKVVLYQFLGETQDGDGKALRLGLLLDETTDTFLGEILFEPFSSYPLRLTIVRNAQDVMLTFESSQGDKLRVFMKLLQVPELIDCPKLLPSDFTDQQKISETYQCLVNAGVRVETRIQFRDYSATLPQLLSTESDYAALEESIHQIANRAHPSFLEAARSFKVSVGDVEVQELRQCLLNQLTQQTSAGKMILLDAGPCNRGISCWQCVGDIATTATALAAYLTAALTLTPVSLGGAVGIITGLIWGPTGIIIDCTKCLGPCNGDPPPPRRGGRGSGGCSVCSQFTPG
ncbi:MAG: choice-of-anchor D domain-containing protein [Candidatus Caldarchaeum sp.]